MCRWVKLYDCLLNSKWHQDPQTVSLVVHLLLLANYKDAEYHGIVIRRGQRVIKVTELAEMVGLSRQQVRTRLEKLEESGFLKVKTTNKASIITICNYDKYQSSINPDSNRFSQNVTSQQQNNQNIEKKYEEENNTSTDETKEHRTRRTFSEETYEERKKAFFETIKPFVERYGRDLCNEFALYWVEPNVKNPYKMRFEEEKNWSLSRRLATWNKKNKEYARNKYTNRSEQRADETKRRREEIINEIAARAEQSNGIEQTVLLPDGL